MRRMIFVGRLGVGLVTGTACLVLPSAIAPHRLAAQENQTAKDLEAQVNADAERAQRFGKATAGSGPTAGGGNETRTAQSSGGRICLLGVCSEGGPQAAQATPGWAGMSARSFVLAFLWDFVLAGTCMDLSGARKELADLPRSSSALTSEEQEKLAKRRRELETDQQKALTTLQQQHYDCEKKAYYR